MKCKNEKKIKRRGGKAPKIQQCPNTELRQVLRKGVQTGSTNNRLRKGAGNRTKEERGGGNKSQTGTGPGTKQPREGGTAGQGGGGKEKKRYDKPSLQGLTNTKENRERPENAHRGFKKTFKKGDIKQWYVGVHRGGKWAQFNRSGCPTKPLRKRGRQRRSVPPPQGQRS